MDLEVDTTLEEITTEQRIKLILEDGLVSLPKPNQLKIGWISGLQLIPDIIDDDIKDYQRDRNKAVKAGTGLAKSGHVTAIGYHNISPNVNYCFVMADCIPQESLSESMYQVLICAHKYRGQIITGECQCTAG